MTKFLQILLLIVTLLLFEVNGKPLFQGISFQRGFEINFKPLPRNPITFIKEKWSPFGVFGRKHSIQKRNSGSGMVPIGQTSPVIPLASGVPEPRAAAPVFEHVDEIEHLHTPSLITLTHQAPTPITPLLIPPRLPPLVSPIQPQLISHGPPIVSFPAPPPMPISVIVTPPPLPPSVFSNVPPPSINSAVVNNIPITSNVPISGPPMRLEGSLPPLSTNMVIPPAPGRFTDISRAEPVREYISSIQPITPPLAVEETAVPPLQTNSIKPVEPPKNDIVINENSLIRGSKLALYFGGIFLQLMSQFMSNARATFDQMTNPPPTYNN